MPRFPVNIPRCGIATISPKGVTRFCKCILIVTAEDKTHPCASAL